MRTSAEYGSASSWFFSVMTRARSGWCSLETDFGWATVGGGVPSQPATAAAVTKAIASTFLTEGRCAGMPGTVGRDSSVVVPC